MQFDTSDKNTCSLCFFFSLSLYFFAGWMHSLEEGVP